MIHVSLKGARLARWAPFFCAAISILLAACSGPGLFDDARDYADDLAEDAGFGPVYVQAAPFVLRAYYRIREPGRQNAGTAPGTAMVYLEGDGNAWENRFTLSDDPTPRDPIGLRLAAADPSDIVFYIARPCQFVGGSSRAGCHPRYWAGARLAPEVVAATDAAISQLKRRTGVERLFLVGYSGGGGLAVLLAARRDDVVGLTTIAGNLDHATWTRHHDVSPMVESMNPLTVAPSLSRLPQVHLVGADDGIMPPLIARSYLSALPAGAPARAVVLDGFDHQCCWVEAWPRLRDRYVMVP